MYYYLEHNKSLKHNTKPDSQGYTLLPNPYWINEDVLSRVVSKVKEQKETNAVIILFWKVSKKLNYFFRENEMAWLNSGKMQRFLLFLPENALLWPVHWCSGLALVLLDEVGWVGQGSKDTVLGGWVRVGQDLVQQGAIGHALAPDLKWRKIFKILFVCFRGSEAFTIFRLIPYNSYLYTTHFEVI